MIDPGIVGGAVIAVSACASGACLAIAYHIPEPLRREVQRPAAGDAPADPEHLQIERNQDREP